MCNRKGCGAGSLRKGYVMAVRLDNRQADFEVRFETLLAAKREATVDVAEAVAGIIADVRARGDVALLELTAKYDRLDAGSIQGHGLSTDGRCRCGRRPGRICGAWLRVV